MAWQPRAILALGKRSGAMATKSSKRRNRKKAAVERKVKNDGKQIAGLERSISKNRNYVMPVGGSLRKYGAPGMYDMGNTNGAALNVLERKLASSYNVQFFDYLASLAHPWTVTNAIIPDWTTFPRGTAQIRTVGTVHMGTSAADNTFMLTLIPALQKSGIFSVPGSASNTTYITVDNIRYGPGQTAGTIFSVHAFNDWSTILSSYRIVSMGVKMQYIGSPLTASGKVATACLPPQVNGPVTYQELAEYNYAYVGKAIEGSSQVLLASGLDAFQMIDIGDTFGTQAFSYIQLAVSGVPNNVDTVQVDWVINIETYSVRQVLTANVNGGKPDANKMSVAHSAMAESHAQKSLNGREADSLKIAKGVLKTGAKIAAPILKEVVQGVESPFFQSLAKGAISLLGAM